MSSYRILPASPAAEIPHSPFNRWILADGTPWLEFYRADSGFLLRFPHLADFTICGTDGAITCLPVPDVPESTLDHLYHNQVRPLALGDQGKLVFHGAAVEVPGGAVAFLGCTGRGKSTMAAAFARSGKPVFTDDALLLEPKPDATYVHPGQPSIRLWEDSEQALIPLEANRAAAVHYTTKTRIFAGATLEFSRAPAVLKAAYFLGPGHCDVLSIERLKTVEAVRSWIQHSHILDNENMTKMGVHFDSLAATLNAVPSFSLDFPRQFETLPDIVAAVEQHSTNL